MRDRLSSKNLIKLQPLFSWCHQHYRERTFEKNQQIPIRSKLLYIVEKGVIRLTGINNLNSEADQDPQETTKEKFLSFVGEGKPFEIVDQASCQIQAYAHVEGTYVIWLYWHDLDNWPDLRREIFDAFREQYQQKLIWLSILQEKRTIDRLLGFLTLLVQEYGQLTSEGYYLPFPVSHGLIGNAIHSTRATVTRLMGKLRQQGLIVMEKEHLICLFTNNKD